MGGDGQVVLMASCVEYESEADLESAILEGFKMNFRSHRWHESLMFANILPLAVLIEL